MGKIKKMKYILYILIVGKIYSEDVPNDNTKYEFVDKIELHFKNNIDYVGFEYFSNNTNIIGDVDEDKTKIPTIGDIYENTNFEKMVEGIVKIIPKISIEILYGETIDGEEKKEFLENEFGTEKIVSFVDEFKTRYGLNLKLCPRTELVKKVFHKLLINTFRSTLEILFDKEVTDTFTESYIKREEIGKTWDRFEKKFDVSKKLNICSDDENKTEVVLKIPEIPSETIDISTNIISSESEMCENESNEIDKNTYLWNRIDFGFITDIEDKTLSGNYFVGAAFGKNTKNNLGKYIVYYEEWGYFGYQPLGMNINGFQKLRVFYASFDTNISIMDKKHCKLVKDGIYCAITYTFIYPDRIYYLRNVFDSDSSTYIGYFIDPYNKNSIRIGAFKNINVREYQKNKYGFIGSYSEESNSCCLLNALDVLVTSQYGSGITCSDGETNEYNQKCNGINGNLYTKKLSINIKYDSEYYKAIAFYLHKGWI